MLTIPVRVRLPRRRVKVNPSRPFVLVRAISQPAGVRVSTTDTAVGWPQQDRIHEVRAVTSSAGEHYLFAVSSGVVTLCCCGTRASFTGARDGEPRASWPSLSPPRR